MVERLDALGGGGHPARLRGVQDARPLRTPRRPATKNCHTPPGRQAIDSPRPSAMIAGMGTGNRTCFRAVWRGSRAAWLLVFFLACGPEQGTAWRDGQEPVVELPILREVSGTWSHISRPVRVVAYDAATLAQIPVTDVPVDFDTEMVLIAALGPTVGQDIGVRITRIWREDGRIHVRDQRLHPGLERTSTLERSSPWTVVVVPRCEAPVEGYSSYVPPGLMGD